MVQRLKRMENMRFAQLQDFTDRLECEPNRRHQGSRQCRVWRSTARIRGWSIDWQKGPMATDLASAPDSKRFQCGGIVAGDRTGGHQLTQSWSHGLVIGPAAAFRRNPGDVAVGILHVAGFAVDAILGVDDKAWPGRLLDPFI